MSTELLNVALGRVDELKAELESLRQENARLREALDIALTEIGSHNCDYHHTTSAEMICRLADALHPPKRS